jgi:hypothetical protein
MQARPVTRILRNPDREVQSNSRAQSSREFDRQVENLIQKGYPAAAGLSAEAFLERLAPLRRKARALAAPPKDLAQGRLPFVIVITSDWVRTETAMSLVEREGWQGCTRLYPREPEDFEPIDGVSIPGGGAYLLVDIDRGQATRNVVPDEALKIIAKQKRSPLTMDEGVAVVTHYPEFLIKNNCFSLLASRHSADKRVPAIWINRDRRANLGWCWAGNPHSWLGSASCGRRV